LQNFQFRAWSERLFTTSQKTFDQAAQTCYGIVDLQAKSAWPRLNERPGCYHSQSASQVSQLNLTSPPSQTPKHIARADGFG
jgi:hypothetical protein